MSKLDDIEYLDTLKLKRLSGEGVLNIYGNGLNQAALEVFVKVLDKNRKPITAADEVQKGLALCFADDDSKLSWQGANGWTFTDVEGEYNGERENAKYGKTAPIVGDDGTIIFKLFVSSTYVESRSISVSVTTSKKHFTTADIASGAEKSSVDIEVVPAINYSDSENTKVIVGAFKKLSTDLLCENILNDSNSVKNGTCERRIVYIKPASTTNQPKFKKHDVEYDHISWQDLARHNSGRIPFTLKGPSSPFAVIRKQEQKQYFQINMWYPRVNDFKMSSIVGLQLLVDGGSWWGFDLHLDVKADESLNVDNGFAELLLFKFSFPINDPVETFFWEPKINTPTIKLTDFYGNTGSFQLTFDDDKHIDEPGRV